jgi:hypothetical protein
MLLWTFFSCFGMCNSCPKFVSAFHLHHVYAFTWFVKFGINRRMDENEGSRFFPLRESYDTE